MRKRVVSPDLQVTVLLQISFIIADIARLNQIEWRNKCPLYVHQFLRRNVTFYKEKEMWRGISIPYTTVRRLFPRQHVRS